MCAMELYDPLIWIIVIAIATVLVLVIIFSRRPRLGTVSAPPDAVFRHIAFQLRALGLRTTQEPGRLKVRVNDFAEVKVRARQGPDGTCVRYEVDATPTGWVLVLILTGFGYLGVIAIAIALYIHVSASSFARERIGPLLRAPIPLVAAPVPLRATMIEGLSEAERLASEAYEYDSEAYQNGQGLIALMSLAIWAFVFIVPLFGEGLILTWFNLLMLAIATMFAVSFLVAGLYILGRRLGPRLEELKRERDLYRSALAYEVSGAPPPAEGAYGLELLLRAADRSFAWREIRRRRKLWHDPVAQFSIFLFAWGAGITGMLAAFLDILPTAMRFVLAVLCIVFAAGFALSIRAWRRQVREEDERERAAWDARKADLENRLRSILGG